MHSNNQVNIILTNDTNNDTNNLYIENINDNTNLENTNPNNNPNDNNTPSAENTENKKLKHKISKYDIVKVKITFPDKHWFIFSRYLLCNVLKVIQIPPKKCQIIASEVKKHLIEKELLEIEIAKFQQILFNHFSKHGYSNLYTAKYKLMNLFHTKRVPIVILLGGSPCIGKSIIANQLSELMNISNVLQTKIVSDVIEDVREDIHFRELWKIENNNEDLIEIFLKESRQVRKGCNYDMYKAFTEGKGVLIEGHHIVPEMYTKLSLNNNSAIENNGTSSIDKEIVLHTPINQDEKEREKAMREEMQNLKQKGLVIPFMLTVSKDNHYRFIENYYLIETKDRANALINFQIIQDYLEKNSLNWNLIEVDWDDVDSVIAKMHEYILIKIEEAHERKVF